MTPAHEVIPGVTHVRIGDNHPTAAPVQAVRVDGPEGCLIIRVEPDAADRARIAAGGSVYLHVWTYGHPLQPFALSTEPPVVEVLTPEGFDRRTGHP